tara:strand:+ start:1813 stop:2235 length:423 start_codon:yes stop_codon:yes gene_type:complete
MFKHNDIPEIIIKIIKSNFFETLRFAGVGIFITLVYSLLLLICLDYYNFHPYLSNIIIVFITSLLSFNLHKNITFKKKDSLESAELIKFFMQILITLFISSLLLKIGSFLNIQNIIIVLAIGILIPMVNYIIMKFWVFKK